ncbi:Heterogeneous nuclear ribonucleoprotein A2 -like protein 2 [Echinococcus granulosus]|nr:Heterogeneous nuclear ribonucleoprotein A2 -like protein 2 [Echinococcus granulosus]
MGFCFNRCLRVSLDCHFAFYSRQTVFKMRSASDIKADQDKKLFVGGLHHSTTEGQLREFYSQWGEITDVVVMKDQRTGKSRGFGFVTFAESSSVDAAQAARPHTIDGKTIDSKRAMPREETSPEVHAAVKKIFVGALKKDVTNEDLSQYFSQFGTVVDASVVMSKDRNESRGFAFVTFDDTDAVDKVILSKPHSINENKIDVRKALSKDEMNRIRARPPRPDPRQSWGNDNSWSGHRYDSGYNQAYGYQGYGNYGNGGGYGYPQGYGYGDPLPSWGPSSNGDSGFGSYQQSYGGGPMRGGPQPYPRSAPYGQNSWQQRQ